MKKAVIAAQFPFPLEVKNRAVVCLQVEQNQPWCDGSHRAPTLSR